MWTKVTNAPGQLIFRIIREDSKLAKNPNTPPFEVIKYINHNGEIPPKDHAIVDFRVPEHWAPYARPDARSSWPTS